MRASNFPAAVIQHGTTGGAIVNARPGFDVPCEMDRRCQKTGAGDLETRAVKIAAKMAEYEGQMGAAYKPAKLLEKAAEGKAFTW